MSAQRLDLRASLDEDRDVWVDEIDETVPDIVAVARPAFIVIEREGFWFDQDVIRYHIRRGDDFHVGTLPLSLFDGRPILDLRCVGVNRITPQEGKQLLEALDDAIFAIFGWGETWADVIKSLRPGERIDWTWKPVDSLIEHLFDPNLEPPEIRPVFRLGDAVIATPGNLQAVVAQAKAGKSAFIGALNARAWTDEADDCLGLKATRNDSGFAMLHFDTEQSRDDHWHGIARAARRAGLLIDEIPEWFRSYCLTGFSARETRAAINRAIRQEAVRCGGVFAIIIDGVADLCADVNDPEECNELIAELHALALEHDAPITCVLHQNPESSKSRGHLGSQLERKSETNLVLEKNGEVTEVYSTKQRRAPIPKGSGVRFRWSDEARMHVTVSGDYLSDAQQEKRAVMLSERDDCFGDRPSMTYTDLRRSLMDTLKRSERTAERKIKAWMKADIIARSVANLWTKKD